MPRPKGKWQNVGRRCSICAHPDRGRIDFLLVTSDGRNGTGRRKLAEKFGVSADALYRHGQQHISQEYRSAVLAAPLADEASLRELAAEEGVSVLQNFRAVFNGHRSRWLQALECADDEVMVRHGRVMTEMLWKIGQLTREIAPNAHTQVQTNIYMSPDFYTFQRRAVSVLRRHPEVLQDWLAEFRNDDPRLIEASPEALGGIEKDRAA
jgi:hypothetical protein